MERARLRTRSKYSQNFFTPGISIVTAIWKWVFLITCIFYLFVKEKLKKWERAAKKTEKGLLFFSSKRRQAWASRRLRAPINVFLGDFRSKFTQIFARAAIQKSAKDNGIKIKKFYEFVFTQNRHHQWKERVCALGRAALRIFLRLVFQ